jgi:hypothetical protein
LTRTQTDKLSSYFSLKNSYSLLCRQSRKKKREREREREREWILLSYQCNVFEDYSRVKTRLHTLKSFRWLRGKALLDYSPYHQPKHSQQFLKATNTCKDKLMTIQNSAFLSGPRNKVGGK